MRCKRCGAPIEGRSGFCPQCGANVQRRRARTMRCRHCGRRVPAQGGLCPACGAELRPSWRWAVLTGLAVVVAALSYYVVADVITIRRIRQQVERLPHFTLLSLMPAPTPTFTLVPTRATETRPTPTRIPTGTPVPSVTPVPQTPSETPSPSAMPAARPPSPTAQPAATETSAPSPAL